ncbi:MAG: hypothetical protein HUJ51_06695 [Eggerthellaceae bacterium]|nr:hypothetical protein [Eggerthellaceae bacterium]
MTDGIINNNSTYKKVGAVFSVGTFEMNGDSINYNTFDVGQGILIRVLIFR